MIIQNKFSNFIIPNKYLGLTVFPFIFVRTSIVVLPEHVKGKLIRHEKIHLRQQLECLFLLFGIIYYGQYIIGRLKGYGHNTAYRLIVFEREAYENEMCTNYLSVRKFWAWARRS